MPPKFATHAEFATNWLQRSPLVIDGVMRKHQLALADRQCRMAYLSQQIQDAVTILCTSLYAARSSDEVVAIRRRCAVPGSHPQTHRPSRPAIAISARSPSLGRNDRRRRIPIDRRSEAGRNSDAVSIVVDRRRRIITMTGNHVVY